VGRRLVRDIIRELMQEAASVIGGHKFGRHFLLTEWEQVVDAWQLEDWEAYRGLGVAVMLKARQTQDVRLETQAVRHWRRSLLLRPDQPKREVLEKLIREHSRLQNSLEGLNY
jgi:hypothetical protein